MAIENWSATPASNTTLGGISTDGSVTLVNQLDNMLRGMMSEVRVGIDAGQFLNQAYAAKSGNYTAVVADRGKLIHFTAAATLTLTTAVTLTAGWWIMVRARGADIVIDPNGAELINGTATQIIRDGDSAYILCDGTGFYTFADRPAAPAVYRNYLINGDFDLWQYATSQTSSGYGSDDRWTNSNNGSTKTHSRQAFALGQTAVPGNPTFFSRTAVTSVANAANFVVKTQRVENVGTLSGKTVTLTFWAKADASKNMAIALEQFFGTGGSPTTTVTIGAQLIPLTTAWTRFSKVFTLPSVSGSTLGSDINDALTVLFWFDAGANNASRSASIGQQSGTFDIAHVALNEGDVSMIADPFEFRAPAEERVLCQRYYEIGNARWDGNVTNATPYTTPVFFKVTKRVIPTVVQTNVSNVSFPATTSSSLTVVSGYWSTRNANTTANGNWLESWTASAEII